MTEEKYLRICLEGMYCDLDRADTPERVKTSRASIDNFYRTFRKTHPELIEEYRKKRGDDDG